MTDIQARHAPAVLANRVQLADRWGQPDLGYVLLFRPDPASTAELAAIQQGLLELEPSLYCQPAAQLHTSVAWLLAVARDFDQPKDEIWQEHGPDWLKAIGAVTDLTAPIRIRWQRLVATDAAIVSVAAEPTPFAEVRRQLVGELDLSWPITYSELGVVHSSLMRYRQPLTDPAGLLARLSSLPIDVETEVTELLMVREIVYPTLDYQVLARLPLRGRA
jgi:hypothetical protein